METMFIWILLLFVYSFLGWMYESILCSIREGQLINRGFLNGPICPVYGFGAILILIFLKDGTNNLLVLYLGAVFLTCTLEYLTSYLMEKIFNTRWWDYSDYPLNLNGRICLYGALVFGTFSLILIKYLHPKVAYILGYFNSSTIVMLGIIFVLILFVDLFFTINHIINLNERLCELQTALNLYRNQSREGVEKMKNTLTEKFENSYLHDKFESSSFYTERIQSIIKNKNFQDKRLANAFPFMKPNKCTEAWEKIKEALHKLKKDESNCKK